MRAGRVECWPPEIKGLGSATRQIRDAPARGLLEPKRHDTRSIDRVTGVAYLHPNEDGTHRIGLYKKDPHTNQNRLVGELDLSAGECRKVDGMEITLNGPGSVTTRYLS